jgi:hypothetical protein
MLYWSIWSLNEWKRVLHLNAQVNHIRMAMVCFPDLHHTIHWKSDDTFLPFLFPVVLYSRWFFGVSSFIKCCFFYNEKKPRCFSFSFFANRESPFSKSVQNKKWFMFYYGRVHSFPCVRVHSLNPPLVRAKYMVRVSSSRKSYYTSFHPNCTLFWIFLIWPKF